MLGILKVKTGLSLCFFILIQESETSQLAVAMDAVNAIKLSKKVPKKETNLWYRRVSKRSSTSEHSVGMEKLI